jgi:FkbM family methyltransferase
MEKAIRSILLRVLGYQSYLSWVSDIYIRLIKGGMLKDKYPELFYLQKIIKPGYTCVDIGANVGYYSVFLSKYAGQSGRVYSIEPVPLFANVFLKNTLKHALNNITLYQTALGAENKKITMGTPTINGVFRHGLTKVLSDDKNEAVNMQTYESDMRIPDELFSPIEKIDFIKCDVEGYEIHLFPHLINTLTKHLPIIQIEISEEENRQKMFDILMPLGYKVFKLQNANLVHITAAEAMKYEGGDFYFKK